MTSFIATCNLGTLRATDPQGRELLQKLKPGQQVEISLKRPRNPRQHRLFWALIGLIYHQQSRYTTQEQLATVIKCAVGWCDEITRKDGTVITIPKSISYASMGQQEFEQFFDKVIELVVTRIIPGVKEADLRRELEEMVK